MIIAHDDLPELTDDEVSRYSRHLILPEISIEGQQKLKKSRVLIVGAGGLGSPVAYYLAASGVGTIGLLDFDTVDDSNLQRQILHGTRDIGRPKVASGADKIKAINPKIKIITFNTKLTSANAADILQDFDVIVDGADNFQTRYLVNDTCVLLGKPYVYGSVFRLEGQVSVFNAYGGPCYRCLYPEPPPVGLVPSCAEGGIISALPGIIGSIQANETLKLLLGGGSPLVGRLLVFDSWNMKFKELKIAKDRDCPLCGENPRVTELIDYEEFCGFKKVTDQEPIEEITAIELKKRLDENIPLQIIDIRQPHELAIGKIPHTKAIPFGQLVRRQEELDSSVDIIIVCKVGILGARAIQLLRESGFKGQLLGLQDGITAWARDVDHSMPRY